MGAVERSIAFEVWALCLGACLAGCGRPQPQTPSPPAPAVVEVKPPPAHAPPDPDSVPIAAEPPSRNPTNLDECVELIQDGKSLPASGNDRALYDKALSEQRAGNLADARKDYFELVKNSPASAFIPLAYLAFAELFRKEAEHKPAMLSLATQAYKNVTDFPPPRNKAYAYAFFRIGEAKQHDNPTEALSSYLTAAKHAPDSPCPGALANAARQRTTDTYAGVGRPGRAWDFFRRTAPDDATAAKMLADLVRKYEAAGKPQDGCKAVRAASAAARASESLKAAASRCPPGP